MRRLLNQAAQSGVKVKGSIFEVAFHRLLPRLGYKKAIWAIAHRLCRVLWIILHRRVSYEERGLAVSAADDQGTEENSAIALNATQFLSKQQANSAGFFGFRLWA
jgi:hypothetical protein